jgi:hypothetical protein
MEEKMAKEPKSKKLKTPLSQSDFERLVSRFASNLEKEADNLFTRDVRDPRRGEAFYWNLRGSILKDFAKALTGAMEG